MTTKCDPTHLGLCKQRVRLAWARKGKNQRKKLTPTPNIKVECSLKSDGDGNLAIRVIEVTDIGDLLEEFKGLTEGEHATMVTRNVGLMHVKVIQILKLFRST